jgi:Cu(I)/Ag(I) efflux system membrane fusion protein
MTLEPFEQAPAPSDAGAAHERPRPRGLEKRDAQAPPPGSTPEGTAPIQLSFDRIQAIGVRTSSATVRDTNVTTRVYAVLEAPEQGASEVHVRTPGFVESVIVDQTGGRVVAGQPLFLFYAPAIYEAEKELLATRRWAADGGDLMTDAAQTKLSLLGVASSEIDAIIKGGAPKRAVTVVAPRGGWVMKKSVTVGSYVTPEMVLYAIQDLSRLFVIANVFQSDRDAAVLGARATFHPARASARARQGRIDLVYPSVDPDARTTRVRMQIDNPDNELLPGEYGIVELVSAERKMTMVPRDAVVNTGTQTYVFVDEGNGRFSPRTVITGPEERDDIAIEAGIAPGERVVSSATFLIDSESRLQASLAGR